MKYQFLTFGAVLVLLLTSCYKNEGTDKPCQPEQFCGVIQPGQHSDAIKNPPPGDIGGDNKLDSSCLDVICTQEFRQIELSVVDANGNPVMLDSYYTEDAVGNKLPAHLYEYNSYTKSYVVFNDSWMNGNTNKSITAHFVGIKNNTRVVYETYKFTSDCCHITKVSGKDRVVLP